MLIHLAKYELNEGMKALFSSEHTLSLKALWCINFEWIHNFLGDTNCHFCFVIQMEDTSTFLCWDLEPGAISLFYFPLIRPLCLQEGSPVGLHRCRRARQKWEKGCSWVICPSSRTEKWKEWERKALETKTLKGSLFIIFITLHMPFGK